VDQPRCGPARSSPMPEGPIARMGMSNAAGRAPLWISFQGASPLILVAWLGWVAAADVLAVAAPLLAGAAGTVIMLMAGGWVLARCMPSPLESFRAYHLDDSEVTSMGPFRRVERLGWDEIRACTQTRRALVLDGPLGRVELPLARLLSTGGWSQVLIRIVPARAHAMWGALERGAIALAPPPDPSTLAVAWWAWGPAVFGGVILGDAVSLVLGMGLAAIERLLVHGRCRWRRVVLQPSGMVVPANGRRLFAAWDAMRVEPTAVGLEVQATRGCGAVPADVQDFWAAAAVIELHAQLGFTQPDDVAFRASVADDGVAVIGEVETR